MTSTPASCTSQSNSTPVASNTRRVASESSGPTPSPGMSVTSCAMDVPPRGECAAMLADRRTRTWRVGPAAWQGGGRPPLVRRPDVSTLAEPSDGRGQHDQREVGSTDRVLPPPAGVRSGGPAASLRRRRLRGGGTSPRPGPALGGGLPSGLGLRPAGPLPGSCGRCRNAERRTSPRPGATSAAGHLTRVIGAQIQRPRRSTQLHRGGGRRRLPAVITHEDRLNCHCPLLPIHRAPIPVGQHTAVCHGNNLRWRKSCHLHRVVVRC